VSIFSAANGMVLTGRACTSRWRATGCSSDRSPTCIPVGTPALRVAFSALWSMVLAVSGTFEQLFT